MSKAFDYRAASVADITKRITSIKGRADTLREDIQSTALACLVQIQEHRNLTPLIELWKAMGAGQRREAFAVWLQKFVVGLGPNKNKKTRDAKPFSLADAVDVDLAGAEGLYWWNAKPEAPVEKLFDIQAATQSLIKRAQAAAKKGQLGPDGVKRLHQLQQVLAEG